MQKRTPLKKFVAGFLQKTKILPALDRLYDLSGQSLTVLTYHRVRPWRDIPPISRTPMELGVDLPMFEAQMRILKEYYHVISQGDVCRWLAGQADIPPRSVWVTFDDGYCDIADFVFPVLTKLKIHATVFIPSAYIGSEKMFWWDMLSAALLNGDISVDGNTLDAAGLPPEHLPAFKQILSLSGSEKAHRVAWLVDRFKKLEPAQAHALSKLLWERTRADADEYALLTWEQIRMMARSGLVSFGSHTAEHTILTNVDLQTVEWEMRTSKQKIESETGNTAAAFAYPSGAFNDSVKRIAREVGYQIAVTTIRGTNTSHSDPFALKRVSMDNCDDALFEMQLSPSYQSIRGHLRGRV